MKKQLALILFVSITLFSCRKKNNSTLEVGPTMVSEYVYGFSSGPIARDAQITVQLAPVQGIQDINAAELIEINPSIDARIEWVGANTIAIQPVGLWEVDEVYNIKIILAKIPSLKDEANFEFTCFTQQPQLELIDRSIRIQSKDLVQLKTEIRSSDFIDAVQLEKSISCAFDGCTEGVQWFHSEDGRNHHFTINNIQRASEDTNAEIFIQKKLLNLKDKFRITYLIPAKNVFKMLDYSISSDEGDAIKIIFSENPKDKQNFTDLITINEHKLTFRLEGNQLIVYPKEKLIGNYGLVISSSLQDENRKNLDKTYTLDIHFKQKKPQVKAVKKGNILPGKQGLFFPFKAIHLNGVNLRIVQIYHENVPYFLSKNNMASNEDIKQYGRLIYDSSVRLDRDPSKNLNDWNVFTIPIHEMINVEMGAIYRILIDFDPSQSTYPCAAEIEADYRDKKPFNTHVNTSDFEDGYYGTYERTIDYHLYSWNERDDPCKASYYMNTENAISQNLYASNIGLLCKKEGTGRYYVFANHLEKSNPMDGVEITFLNKQLQEIGKGTTNNKGQVVVELQGLPKMIRAKKNKDISYLSLQDGEVLSTSIFDVEGQKIKEGVKGFLYAERGVWRPGDSVHLFFVVNDAHTPLPKDHPILFQLFDVQNRKIKTQVQPRGNSFIHNFKFKTNESDPTGTYRAQVNIGDALFTKNIRIETIEPNRISISNNLPDKNTKLTDLKSVSFEANWLHGQPAADLDYEINGTLIYGNTFFPAYPDYTFKSPVQASRSWNKGFAKGKTNANGNFTVEFPTPKKLKLDQMSKLKLTTKVFEKSGAFSIVRKSYNLSPITNYVGIKNGNRTRDRYYWNLDDHKELEFITVDQFGKAVANRNLQLSIYQINYNYWYERDTEGLTNLANSNQAQTKINTSLTSNADGKATFEIPENLKWKRLLCIVKDPATGHQSGIKFYMYGGWNSNNNDGNDESASLLPIKLNKSTYQAGEQVEVSIPSNGKGHIRLFVENANRIIQVQSKQAAEGTTKFNFDVNGEMTPNIYISVHYVQPHAETLNDAPVRLFGIASANIVDARNELMPQVHAPTKVKPNATYNIEVSEQHGAEMEYTLAVVDEGYLQLTNYTTPDLYREFNQKEAYQIKNWDLYKYVMGAFAADMQGLSAVGGDEAINENGDSETNRFESVVQVKGPFTLAANATDKISFTMPNYVGAVRIMLCAASKNAHGSTSKPMKVKQDLMIQASAPLFLSAGEEAKMGVTVFALDDKIQTVKLDVKNKNGLVALDKTSYNINMQGQREKHILIPIKVGNRIGMDEINISATSSGERGTAKATFEISAPNPLIKKRTFELVAPGTSKTFTFENDGFEGTNHFKTNISYGIPIDFNGALEDLIRYPSGCLEQITSAAYPQLFVGSFTELNEAKKREIRQNIQYTIAEIIRRADGYGKITYWPGGDYYSSWAEIYAGLFLLDAEQKGYNYPESFKKSWIKRQLSLAREWNKKKPAYDDQNQAYRLFALAQYDQQVVALCNRFFEDSKPNRLTDNLIAGAYSHLGYPELAKHALARAQGAHQPTAYGYRNPTFGSELRDQALMLNTYIEMKDTLLAATILQKIAESYKHTSWMSTQTKGQLLAAIAKYKIHFVRSKSIPYSITWNGDQKSYATEVQNMAYDFIPKSATNTITIKNEGNQALMVHYNYERKPIALVQTASSKNLKLNNTFEDEQGQRINPSELKQGTDFYMLTTITNPGSLGYYENMALIQEIPHGWKIHNERLDEIMSEDDDPSQTDNPITYQDIRDDRIMSYFDIASGQKITLRTKLTTTFAGDFFLPPSTCEAMYSNDIYARTSGQKIKVQ